MQIFVWATIVSHRVRQINRLGALALYLNTKKLTWHAIAVFFSFRTEKSRFMCISFFDSFFTLKLKFELLY